MILIYCLTFFSFDFTSHSIYLLRYISDCGTLEVTNGTVEAPKGTTFGQVAIISCITGFERSGASFVTCLSDQTWSNVPTCTIRGKYYVMRIYHLIYISIVCITSTFTNSIVFKINENHLSFNCGLQFISQWLFSFMETDCGVFAVAGGTLNSTDTTYGSAIEVTCDSGHSVTGSSVVECQADGTWSSSPTCVEDGMLYRSHEIVHCLPCTRHNDL